MRRKAAASCRSLISLEPSPHALALMNGSSDAAFSTCIGGMRMSPTWSASALTGLACCSSLACWRLAATVIAHSLLIRLGRRSLQASLDDRTSTSRAVRHRMRNHLVGRWSCPPQTLQAIRWLMCSTVVARDATSSTYMLRVLLCPGITPAVRSRFVCPLWAD